MAVPFARMLPLTLFATLFAPATLHASDITRGNNPAELTIAPAGAHALRITLKPLTIDLPPSPSLLSSEIKNPALTLRTLDAPAHAHIGNLDVEVTPAPLTITIKNTQHTLQSLTFDPAGTVSFTTTDSPILGLGEGGAQPARGQPPIIQFDRRGRLDPMRPGWGSGTLGSRNPVPLLIGTDTAGSWALFVASPWVQVDLRDPTHGLFIPTNNATPTAGARGAVQPPTPGDPPAAHGAAQDQPFDLFLFDATNPADLMQDLRTLTGPPAMPPKWALGYQQSHRELRDAILTPQQLILSEIDTFRQKQIPIDSVVYLGTGFTPTGWNTTQPSFDFNPKVFSDDPKSVLQQLHDKHVKVVLHMVDLPPREQPHLTGNIPPLPSETLDQNHILLYWKRHEPLIAAGVDAFWPDEGDRFSIAERMTREKMYFQGGLATSPDSPPPRPWTLNRNGVIGMAQWGAWMWSGDTQSRWNTLRDQIWIGQNVSLSITPYWGSDTGGFYTTSELSGELYARWLQFSAFTPSFRAHGRIWRLRLPWGWGLSDWGFPEGQTDLPAASERNNPAIEPIAKKYIDLRYQLIPYTYTLARQAYDTGMPLMRPLWLHYPTDKTALSQSEEFLWGPDMLIAPVYEKAATTRTLYLPAGTWYDFWDNSPHTGPATLTRPVDLATMPIYIRAGAILPLDPIRQYMSQPVTAPTTLKIYAGANGDFTLYEDDGTSQAYQQNKATWTKFTWNDTTRKLTLTPAPPQGTTNTPIPPHPFQIHLLPTNTTKSIIYDGHPSEIQF